MATEDLNVSSWSSSEKLDKVVPEKDCQLETLRASGVEYRKTPSISTYVFSGLATDQVLIFRAILTFGGYDKAEWKILQGRSPFNPVLSAHNMLLCIFQRLCTYFQYTGVLIFGGYVLSGHCNRQQISVKTEGVLNFGGVLIYGVLRYVIFSRFFFWNFKFSRRFPDCSSNQWPHRAATLSVGHVCIGRSIAKQAARFADRTCRTSLRSREM